MGNKQAHTVKKHSYRISAFGRERTLFEVEEIKSTAQISSDEATRGLSNTKEEREPKQRPSTYGYPLRGATFSKEEEDTANDIWEYNQKGRSFTDRM